MEIKRENFNKWIDAIRQHECPVNLGNVIFDKEGYDIPVACWDIRSISKDIVRKACLYGIPIV